MITACQGAKVKVANSLLNARNELISIRSSILFENGQHHKIDQLVSEIDDLFSSIIPNEGIKQS